MISMDLLRYLAYIWVTEGYAEFKVWVKDLGLKDKGLKDKGFTVTEIRKTILEDSELMSYYIQNGAYEIIENPVYKKECEKIAKECVLWYEDNSHKI